MSDENDIPLKKSKKSKEPIVNDVPPKKGAPLPGYFAEEPPQGPTFMKLAQDQSFIDGLRTLDKNLLTRFAGKHGLFTRLVVLPGHIGMGSKYGQTKFFPPGNYFWTGIGGKWNGAVELQKAGEDIKLTNGEVTLLSLTENQTAVVQIDRSQYVIGSGRYIIRQPARMEGDPINVQNLKEKHTAFVINESGEEKTNKDGKVVSKDVRTTKEVTAGSIERQGAITFIRPEPGFRYVIQEANDYRIGEDCTIARGEEKFLMFLNFLQQSRTTRTFSFLSKDFHEVKVRIQLTWQMDDGVSWLKNGRGYDDPFDFLEEKAEAAFRDQICALTHVEALSQKSDGFDNMEKNVLPKLTKNAAAIGARLMGMEVRELSFPLIETREKNLAEKEALAKEAIRQREVDIKTQQLEDEKKSQAEKAEQVRKIQSNKAESEALAIKDARKLAELEATNQRKQSEVEAEALQEMARLEAKLKQEKVNAATALTQAEGEAAAARAKAIGEAVAFAEVAKAKTKALLDEAEAQATAARKMGEALAASEGLLELEKAKLVMQVEMEKAKASAAFAKNPNALLAADLARDYGRTRMGFAPQEVLPVLSLGPVGSSSSSGSDKKKSSP